MTQITSLGSNAFKGLHVAADWIHALTSSNSRNYKERVIERAIIAARLGSSSAQCFLYNCYLAYNPFYVYHVKNVPKTRNLDGKENPWVEFWGLIEDLRTMRLTGNRAENSITQMCNRFDSDEWNLVARAVLLKDLRCGIAKKTFNKVLGSTEWRIPVFDCQLAQDSENHPQKLFGNKRIEPKLDGIRALAVVTASSIVIYSRTGKILKNFSNIENSIFENNDIIRSEARLGTRYVIDGEIVTKDFQQLMTQVHRKTDVKVDDAVFYIFDIIPLDDFINGKCELQQCCRHEIVQRISKKMHQRTIQVQGVKGIDVDLSTSEGHNIMHRYAQSSVYDGFEGIVIKDVNAFYTSGRNNAWLKWKPTHTVDLTVVGIEQGTGKNANRLGSLICHGYDNGRSISVSVGSGFSDSLRDDIWAGRDSVIGKIVEIKCDSVSTNKDGTYSLRFPRFSRFRGFSPNEKL